MIKIYIIIILVLFTSQGLISDELKLTHPNGGEVFEAGAETAIRWKGISDTTKVKLSFSSDNGNTWRSVVDSIDGLNFDWKIPIVESDNCLVKLNTYATNASVGKLEWSTTFNDSIDDNAISVTQISDGSYIVVGTSAVRIGRETYADAWILKLDWFGNVEWSKTFGGTKSEHFASVLQISDGGYMIAGASTSSDGDLAEAGNRGQEDVWILKLNRTGNVEWSKTYGGSSEERVISMLQTVDGGFLISSYSNSNDGDLTEAGNRGQEDVWLLKLDRNGNIEWSKTYGGTKGDYAMSIIQTSEGGFLLAGQSYSSDGDLEGKVSSEFSKAWVLKIFDSGEIEWSKTYGGNKQDYAMSIIQTSDGNYILAGASNSVDGDLEGTENKGTFDGWILKILSTGEVEWSKTYGGSKYDSFSSIFQTSKGEYLLVGESFSADGNLKWPSNKGQTDIWFLKLLGTGDIEWTNTYGGSRDESINSVIQITNEEYIIAGSTNSSDFDLEDNPIIKLGYDAWIAKISGLPQPLQSDTSDAVFSIKFPDFDYYAYTNDQNSTVTATVILEENTNITLEIYDILGRRMVDLYSGEAAMGKNEYTVNVNDFQSGRYYIKLTTPTITKTEIIEVVR